MGSATTIRDVAKASNVSAATVSIVLNNAPLARYISPQTKERIQKAAKKLGYRPNMMARSLRSKRNHTVGVMVFDVTDPFCTPILRGIENALYEASCLPIFTDAHNDGKRFERYLEMLLDRRVEGLIIVANWLFVDVNLLADLENRNIPTAVICRDLQKDSVSSVLVDNESGAHMAIEHLYHLGHRKIAFIRGPKMLGDSSVRWKGVQSFARSVGLDIDSRLVVDLPGFLDPKEAVDNGSRATENLLATKHAFTALMAFDDMTALGALSALKKANIAVPEKCSVIGFDDVVPAAFSAPPLTTIRQPMEAMGTAAVNVVMDGIQAGIQDREFVATHTKVAPKLVVRKSTAPNKA